MNVLVSLRGFVDYPILMEVDLNLREVVRRYEFNAIDLSKVRKNKRGFTGIAWYGDKVAAATWDRVCILDLETTAVYSEISHREFSDLHGLSVDQDGNILLASTTLNRIYKISDQTVAPLWHPPGLFSKRKYKKWEHIDFREVYKKDSPFHKHHLNSVLSVGDFYIVSYLGQLVEQDEEGGEFRIRDWFKRDHDRIFDGGIFVVDRSSGRVIRRYRFEGIHDTVLINDHEVAFTEYFGNAILILDLNDLSVRRIPLETGSYQKTGYLTRGIVADEESFWVGQTPHRGTHQGQPVSKIQQFAVDGKIMGHPIELDGYFGIFSMIEK